LACACVLDGADVATKGHSRFFAELKLGLGDSPNLKAMVGWSGELASAT